MAVMDTQAQQLADLHLALMAVGTDGQAVAAADKAIETVQKVADQYAPWVASLSGGPVSYVIGAFDALFRSVAVDRTHNYAQLTDALADIKRYRDPMAGAASATPVVAEDWDSLYHAIEWAYNVMWSIQGVEGDGSSEWAAFVSFVGQVVADSIAALPDVIRAAAGYVGDVAGAVAGGVGSAVTGTLWDAVKGLWPVLLVGAAVIAAGVYAIGPDSAKKLARSAVL